MPDFPVCRTTTCPLRLMYPTEVVPIVSAAIRKTPFAVVTIRLYSLFNVKAMQPCEEGSGVNRSPHAERSHDLP